MKPPLYMAPYVPVPPSLDVPLGLLLWRANDGKGHSTDFQVEADATAADFRHRPTAIYRTTP